MTLYQVILIDLSSALLHSVVFKNKPNSKEIGDALLKDEEVDADVIEQIIFLEELSTDNVYELETGQLLIVLETDLVEN